ncbi:FkbM family methyltransferase [Pseudomonas fragi]|uniref:FkbM family methyltransferase n=1 Tax=Pseudomonas fragi TaxID=296 RepID=UPI0014727881|nr:FkbM family methyltransferase [Pseudomonas fragi]NNB22797.1 FkbM family methyltransferase [Pseudomonas fragi]
MTFISYAQNFEDIRLWRIFRTVKDGFYIDVGANDPVRDSVTKAFYDRGWSGINVEPMPNYFDALCEQRPRDTNLQCVAGITAEDLTFYSIADTGLSTLDQSLAQKYKDTGMGVREEIVRSRTLTSICEEHVNDRPIYFLKVDVEGHEETVLRGMDFTRWRPWVILVETPWERDQVWETILTDAGYHSVVFDGINTFYLAEEHLNLKPAFDPPPCNLDEFQFCKGHKFSHPIDDIEQQLELSLKRAEQAESELMAMRNSRTWKMIHRFKKALMRA